MSVFLVALSEPDTGAWISVQTEWPEHHLLISDTLALVAPPGIQTTSEIQGIVGIRAELNTPTGMVIELVEGKYNGVLPANTVDWLRKARGYD